MRNPQVKSVIKYQSSFHEFKHEMPEVAGVYARKRKSSKVLRRSFEEVKK